MGSFLSVCAVIIIAVCFVAGAGVISFLSAHLVPISIIFWGGIFVFAYYMFRQSSDPHEKSIALSIPICILPTYAFIVRSALPEICAMKGFFEPFLAICIELPMAVCFTLLVSIAIGWIGTRFRMPAVAVPIVLTGNIFFTLWVTTLGV